MAEHYWTVGHDYDWRTPAELSVYGISYATEELAVEAARRLLRYLLWSGCIREADRIRYPWGFSGSFHWKDVSELSHDKKGICRRASSISEGRDGTTVTLDYTIDARNITRRTETKSQVIDGETYSRQHETVKRGPWGPLLGRAYGEEWQHLSGRLYAYIGCVEITTELPELSNLG